MRYLLDYEYWANKRVLEKLLSYSPDIPESASLLFSHILRAEEIWWQRVTHDPVVARPWQPIEPDSWLYVLDRNRENWSNLAEEEDEAGWQQNIAYRNASGVRFDTELFEIFLHLTHHSAYHRGQIASSLKLAGLEPVSTDLILYSRQLNN